MLNLLINRLNLYNFVTKKIFRISILAGFFNSNKIFNLNIYYV